MAEIAQGNYDRSILLFVDGLKKLVVSRGEIAADDFEYVFAALESVVKYKIGLLPEAPRQIIERNCSFCGKDEAQATQLIAGPGVFICDACVTVCNKVVEQKLPGKT
jgi:hypothetical protein